MLQVRQVSFGFSSLPLFKNVTFSVQPGRVLQLTGPNGVGKSTLMQILAGILAPQTGDITFDWSGKTLTDRREALSYLPSEGNGLYLRQDAMNNLHFWARLSGRLITDGHIRAALEDWGLTNRFFHRNFPVGKFSTGMKRRLALARLSLIGHPLWLLDEPVYGLDPDATERFRRHLGDHVRNGGSAVLISHDAAASGNLDIIPFVMGAPQLRGNGGGTT